MSKVSKHVDACTCCYDRKNIQTNTHVYNAIYWYITHTHTCVCNTLAYWKYTCVCMFVLLRYIYIYIYIYIYGHQQTVLLYYNSYAWLEREMLQAGIETRLIITLLGYHTPDPSSFSVLVKEFFMYSFSKYVISCRVCSNLVKNDCFSAYVVAGKLIQEYSTYDGEFIYIYIYIYQHIFICVL